MRSRILTSVFIGLIVVFASFLAVDGMLIKDAAAVVRRTRTVSRGGHTRSTTVHRGVGDRRSATVVHRGGTGSVAYHHSSTAVGRHRPYHPVAGGVAVGAAVGTAVAIGTRVAVLPSAGCATFDTGGVTYRQCGSVFYRPYYEGSSVVYVVVGNPY